MTGLAPDFAAQNIVCFTAPYAVRAKLGRPVIDRANKAVYAAAWVIGSCFRQLR